VVVALSFEELYANSSKQEVARRGAGDRLECPNAINFVDEQVLGAILSAFSAKPQVIPIPADPILAFADDMLGSSPALIGSGLATSSNGLKVGLVLDPGERLPFDSSLLMDGFFYGAQGALDWTIRLSSS
jgi:hypothetical protein